MIRKGSPLRCNYFHIISTSGISPVSCTAFVSLLKSYSQIVGLLNCFIVFNNGAIEPCNNYISRVAVPPEALA
jgi:hypothetical protein